MSPSILPTVEYILFDFAISETGASLDVGLIGEPARTGLGAVTAAGTTFFGEGEGGGSSVLGVLEDFIETGGDSFSGTFSGFLTRIVPSDSDEDEKITVGI